jgi:hypothetical protein
VEWNEVDTGTRFRQFVASGEMHAYTVFTDSTDTVRLTRWLPRVGQTQMDVAREASRNTIVFPLGRGPGRPGMEPELAVLAESAKVFAEAFEAGESLKGYPAWQHERSTARFLATGDANDCPNC